MAGRAGSLGLTARCVRCPAWVGFRSPPPRCPRGSPRSPASWWAPRSSPTWPSALGVLPIVGFLLAGVLIGPNALGVVGDREMVDAAAEIGVILLLFTLGIEFSLERLRRIRRVIFVGGGLQVGLATWLHGRARCRRRRLAHGALHRLAGRAVSSRRSCSSCSPTAARPTHRHGPARARHADLPGPRGRRHGAARAGARRRGRLARRLARGARHGGRRSSSCVLVVARRVMPPVLEAVARTCSPEVFLLTVIADLPRHRLPHEPGRRVSVSLGAFLAGLVVSESRFSQHALGEILPLQILFSATFFVSVGMLLDLGFLVDEPAAGPRRRRSAVLAGEGAHDRRRRAGARRRLPRRGARHGARCSRRSASSRSCSSARARASACRPAGLGEDGSQAFIAADRAAARRHAGLAAGRRPARRPDDAARRAAARAARHRARGAGPASLRASTAT